MTQSGPLCRSPPAIPLPRSLPLDPAPFCGERDGTRTHDPLIKSQMLYRLSYALPFWAPVHSPQRRERSSRHRRAALGLQHAPGRRRANAEQMGGAHGPRHESAGAVRTPPSQHLFGTGGAERAFETAGPRRITGGRKVAVAAFAIRAQVQHGMSMASRDQAPYQGSGAGFLATRPRPSVSGLRHHILGRLGPAAIPRVSGVMGSSRRVGWVRAG